MDTKQNTNSGTEVNNSNVVPQHLSGSGAQNPTKVSPEFLKVHCPKCYKMYSVNPDLIEINKPEFKCPSCLAQFWISFDEAVRFKEVVGYLSAKAGRGAIEKIERFRQMDVPQVDFEIEKPISTDVPNAFAKSPLRQFEFENVDKMACPNCEAMVAKKLEECPSCGIVFKKFKQFEKESLKTPSAGKELKAAWESILMNYGDQNLHEKFVNLGMAEGNLGYCANKYQTILEANPTDDIAVNMKKRIVALVAAPVEARITGRQVNEVWKRFHPSTLLIAIGTIMIVLGFAVPQTRSIVGVGFSLVFFALAYRYYSQTRN